MQKTIAVIFGGVSNENEISVITGTMAINVLKGGGYSVVPVYISQSGDMYTDDGLSQIANFKDDKFTQFPKAIFAKGGIYSLNKRGKPKKFTSVDCALNCCHGGAGEGGAVCGLCLLNDIPLASAGLFESSAFMDKYITKLVLSALNVKTADYAYLKSGQNLDSRANIPDFPVIVKPVNLGSSIGVQKAENKQELQTALDCAFLYDSAVIIEKYVENRREINCAAYFADGEVVTSECEEPLTSGEVYSFEDKYQGGTKSVFPADIPPDMARLIKKTTRDVYEKLNMRGVVRFDYIIDKSEVYLSEINTVPGSLSYYLLSSGFKDFINVLEKVLNQAQTDFTAAKGKKLLHTGILENIPAGGGKLSNK